MKKVKKVFKGISFQLDELFFRNLTIILASVLIWRGSWNLLDKFLFPDSPLLSSFFSIIFGIFLLFIFDSEVESESR